MPGIRDLFEVAALKGATLSPRWGFSLEYVPHVTAGGIKWHRTEKSAIFDIVDDPVDITSPNEINQSPFSMFTMDGTVFLEKAAIGSAEASVKESTKFWELVHSESDIIRVAEMLRSRPVIRFGFYNYVQQPMALAFTLARVGQLEEARTELQSAHGYATATPEIRSTLEALLNNAAGRGPDKNTKVLGQPKNSI